MTLRFRILLLAGVVAALYILLISYNLFFYFQTSQNLSTVVEKTLNASRTAETMNVLILEIRTEIWDTMIFESDKRGQLIPKLNSQAVNFYDNLRTLGLESPERNDLIFELRKKFQGYYQFGMTILESKSLADFMAQTDIVGKFKENQMALTKILASIVGDIRSSLDESMFDLQEEFRDRIVQTLILSIVVLMISVVISLIIARRLTRPLEILTSTAINVSQGNFDIRPVIQSGWEVQALGQAISTMLDEIGKYNKTMENLVQIRTRELAGAHESMLKELRFAKKIQKAIMPPDHNRLSELSMVGLYLPMEDLGGDFFDVFSFKPGEIHMVIADVSGHGVPAALVTAMIKVSLQNYGRSGIPPHEVVDKINRELQMNLGILGMYVTMIYAIVDLNQGEIQYCNAGHNEMIILDKEGHIQVLLPNSGIVGVRTDELFLSFTTPFHPGDTFLLFTDGLIETRSPVGEQRSFSILREKIQAWGGETLTSLVQNLSDWSLNFLDGQAMQDDITILAARWDPQHLEIQKSQNSAPSGELTLHEKVQTFFALDDLMGLNSFLTSVEGTTQNTDQESMINYWRGLIFCKMGKYEDALKCWDRALEIRPGQVRVLRDKKRLQSRQGESP